MKIAVIGILMFSVGMPIWANDVGKSLFADMHLQNTIPELQGIEKGTRTIQVRDPDTGICSNVQLEAIGWFVNQYVEFYLGVDQMLICNPFGACHVITVPLSNEEWHVLYSNSGPPYSIRPVHVDLGTVERFAKVYFRVFARPVPNGERHWNSVFLGKSWNNVREILVMPKGQPGQQCNSGVVTSTSPHPGLISFVLDNHSCDPVPGAHIVARFAMDVTDNQCAGNADANEPVTAAVFAPVVFLHEERKPFDVMHGETLLRINVKLCAPLP